MKNFKKISIKPKNPSTIITIIIISAIQKFFIFLLIKQKKYVKIKEKSRG